MADSKISNLPILTSPNNSDVLPIVNSSITKQITVANLLAGASNLQLPITKAVINGTTGIAGFYGGSGDTNNSQDYIMFLNSKSYETDSSVIEGNLTNMNMIIKTSGKYQVEGGVSFYNITSSGNNFVRLRLYGDTTAFAPGVNGTFQGIGSGTPNTGGTLLATLEQGYVGTTISGEAGKQGSTIIEVTSTPYYLVLVFLHGGATGGSGTQAFIGSNSTFGLQPEFIVRKIPN